MQNHVSDTINTAAQPRLAPAIALDLFCARRALQGEAPGMRRSLAQEIARRHGGRLIDPSQNHQPDHMPRLASFRLGRIIGTGATVEAAIADWMERAAMRGAE